MGLCARTALLLLVLCGVALGDSPTQKVVTYGSAVSIVHVNTRSKLFSTKISWGSGSGQQIVTGLLDDAFEENTLWIVKPRFDPYAAPSAVRAMVPTAEGGKFDNATTWGGSAIACGSIIRLEHFETEKNLHAHDRPSPISSSNYEVSGFGTGSSGDLGDNFLIECTGSGSKWQVEEPIMFHHVEMKSYMVTTPRTKFSQDNCPRCPIVGHLEVSLARNPSTMTKNSNLWKATWGLAISRSDDEDDDISGGSGGNRDEL